jgi:hypothetical protein
MPISPSEWLTFPLGRDHRGDCEKLLACRRGGGGYPCNVYIQGPAHSLNICVEAVKHLSQVR